jgi:hypothetical protein
LGNVDQYIRLLVSTTPLLALSDSGKIGIWSLVSGEICRTVCRIIRMLAVVIMAPISPISQNRKRPSLSESGDDHVDAASSQKRRIESNLSHESLSTHRCPEKPRELLSRAIALALEHVGRYITVMIPAIVIQSYLPKSYLLSQCHVRVRLVCVLAKDRL